MAHNLVAKCIFTLPRFDDMQRKGSMTNSVTSQILGKTFTYICAVMCSNVQQSETANVLCSMSHTHTNTHARTPSQKKKGLWLWTHVIVVCAHTNITKNAHINTQVHMTESSQSQRHRCRQNATFNATWLSVAHNCHHPLHIHIHIYIYIYWITLPARYSLAATWCYCNFQQHRQHGVLMVQFTPPKNAIDHVDEDDDDTFSNDATLSHVCVCGNVEFTDSQNKTHSAFVDKRHINPELVFVFVFVVQLHRPKSNLVSNVCIFTNVQRIQQKIAACIHIINGFNYRNSNLLSALHAERTIRHKHAERELCIRGRCTAECHYADFRSRSRSQRDRRAMRTHQRSQNARHVGETR